MPSDTPFDLDAEIDGLYQLPLTGFVAARDALSKGLRQTGEREAAARVKTLSKPGVSAWAVNQVYWRHRREFDRLLEAGKRVREAQSEGAAALREASGARRLAESECLRLAEQALREDGHAAGPVILKRVATSFEALAAYGPSQPDPPPGRLVEDVASPGFDAFAGVALAQATPRSKPVSKSVRKTGGPEPPTETEPSDAALRRTRARAALKSAREGLVAAEAAWQRAKAAVDQQVNVLLAAQQRWAEAVAQLHEADQRARDAARFREQAAARLSEAESAVGGG